MPDIADPSTMLLEDLLALPTSDELVTVHLGILEDAGFPVTSWDPTDPFSVFITGGAKASMAYAQLTPEIAAAPFRTLAKGDWLTLLARSNWEIERTKASVAKRKLRLTDAGFGGGTLSADSVKVKSDTDLIYILDEDATVPAAGHVDATFRAESPGSVYNGSVVSYELVTAIAGLDVADAPAGVTVPGLDEQSDDSLSEEMGDQWSTLGRGATDDAYEYIAKNVTTIPAGTVTRVSVQRRTPLPGQVTIYVAGPTSASPVDGADALDGATIITPMQNFIDPPGHVGARAPNCVDVFVHSAKYKKIPIVGTIQCVAAERAAAQANAEKALNAYAANFPIGGGEFSGPVDLTRVLGKIAAQLSDDPRNDIDITSPAADVGLLVYEIPYFDFSGIVWNEV